MSPTGFQAATVMGGNAQIPSALRGQWPVWLWEHVGTCLGLSGYWNRTGAGVRGLLSFGTCRDLPGALQTPGPHRRCHRCCAHVTAGLSPAPSKCSTAGAIQPGISLPGKGCRTRNSFPGPRSGAGRAAGRCCQPRRCFAFAWHRNAHHRPAWAWAAGASPWDGGDSPARRGSPSMPAHSAGQSNCPGSQTAARPLAFPLRTLLPPGRDPRVLLPSPSPSRRQAQPRGLPPVPTSWRRSRAQS